MIAFEPIENLEAVLLRNIGEGYHYDEIIAADHSSHLVTEDLMFAFVDESDRDIMWEVIASSSYVVEQTDCIFDVCADECNLSFYYTDTYFVVFIKSSDLEFAENILNSFL